MKLSMFPVKLQKQFEADIVNGILPVGKHIEVDTFQQKYASGFGDAYIVLRSAWRKGLLDCCKGGAYTVLGKSRSSVRSVFQHAASSGLSPKSVVRALKVVPANETVAAHLQIEAGYPVFCQTRTRLVNDEVAANQNNYIPIDVCPTLADVDLSQRSFQVTLNEDFNTVITEIQEEYQIAPPEGEDAHILDLKEGEDVLVVRRLSLSPTGQPLVWADIHVRLDRFHYVEALWPRAAEMLKKEGLL